MCGPAIPIMMIASAAYSANAQKKSGEYNAQVQNENAAIDQWKANDAIQRGDIASNNVRMKTAQQISGARAMAAANGGSVDFGSNVNIQSTTAQMGELDALTVRSNARREAYGDQIYGTNAAAQGQLDRYQGNTQAAGSLLGGASKAYGNFMTPKPAAGGT